MHVRRASAGLLAAVLSFFLCLPAPPPAAEGTAPDDALRALPPGGLTLSAPPDSRPAPWPLAAPSLHGAPPPLSCGLTEAIPCSLPPSPALCCLAHPQQGPPVDA